MDQHSIEQLREYLDNALDSLGNAISVLEDADQQPGTLHALRGVRAEVINIIDMTEVAETAKEPQPQRLGGLSPSVLAHFNVNPLSEPYEPDED